MRLFKKKESIPNIPSASTLPDLPSIEQPESKNLPELSSFPSNSQNKNINQEIVKSAVSDISFPEENEVNVEIPKELHVKEERGNMIPSRASIKSLIPEPPTRKPLIKETQTPQYKKPKHSEPKSDEPIFVRIDKFQSAQKNFETIKEKISKIENILAKIKNTKSKEEEELKGWTEDIEKIKTRLSEIDTEIFSQI